MYRESMGIIKAIAFNIFSKLQEIKKNFLNILYMYCYKNKIPKITGMNLEVIKKIVIIIDDLFFIMQSWFEIFFSKFYGFKDVKGIPH